MDILARLLPGLALIVGLFAGSFYERTMRDQGKPTPASTPVVAALTKEDVEVATEEVAIVVREGIARQDKQWQIEIAYFTAGIEQVRRDLDGATQAIREDLAGVRSDLEKLKPKPAPAKPKASKPKPPPATTGLFFQ